MSLPQPSGREYTLISPPEAPPIFTGHLRLGGMDDRGNRIALTNYYLLYNDQPYIPVMGEFHFSRFPHQEWEQELRKIRAGGVQVVASYLFWIHVEEDEGVFTWSGDNDVRTFVALCQKVGLQVLLRIGPFAHGECRNGGLPDWLYGQPFPLRSNDHRYLQYVRRYFAQIAQQIEGQLFKDGGPIIGIQLENEYMHAGAPWEVTFRSGTEWVPIGADGEAHMLVLKAMARELGMEVPLYTCTGWVGSPVPAAEFLPMQGGYAFTPWVPDPTFVQDPTWVFLFRNRHEQPLRQADLTYQAVNYPYACCELGGGIQITYHHRPIVPAECAQALAIVALGNGANLLGYYMYHGGSNPIGKHSYLNEFTVPRISYDFQAPLREYGQLHPSYHRLRTLHLFLQDFGTRLAPLPVVLPEGAEQLTPTQTQTLRFAARTQDGVGFLFVNNYQDHVAMPSHEQIRFRLALPQRDLVFPQGHALTVVPNCSAILPFHLELEAGVLLHYATVQPLMTLRSADAITQVFFAPEDMYAELAFDAATFLAVEVTGGELRQEDGYAYVIAEPGLDCSITLTALDGTPIRVLILTQTLALASWKLNLWGQERLVISEALVLSQDHKLEFSWREQESTTFAIYPPVADPITAHMGELTYTTTGLFTHGTLSVPPYQSQLQAEHLDAHTLNVTLPADLFSGVEDLFLTLDFLGDMGHAYLNGKLIADHFANGLPWEIGLKRFFGQRETRQLTLHLSPLRPDAEVMRYFPTGMAFRPSTEEIAGVEVRSLVLIPQYHSVLALSVEGEASD